MFTLVNVTVWECLTVRRKYIWQHERFQLHVYLFTELNKILFPPTCTTRFFVNVCVLVHEVFTLIHFTKQQHTQGCTQANETFTVILLHKEAPSLLNSSEQERCWTENYETIAQRTRKPVGQSNLPNDNMGKSTVPNADTGKSDMPTCQMLTWEMCQMLISLCEHQTGQHKHPCGKLQHNITAVFFSGSLCWFVEPWLWEDSDGRSTSTMRLELFWILFFPPSTICFTFHPISTAEIQNTLSELSKSCTNIPLFLLPQHRACQTGPPEIRPMINRSQP